MELKAESKASTEDFAVSVLYAITFGDEWLHRKVDSIRLLDGPTNLRRVSLDLTVPQGLVIPEGTHAGLLFLPMSIVSKQPLRAFDATRGASEPLPVADSALNGWAMSLAVSRAFEFAIGRPMTPALTSVIDEVVSGPAGSMVLRDLDELFRTGKWRGQGRRLFNPKKINAWARDLLYVFSQNFLLAALVDPELEAKRLILKYRYHWDVSSRRWGEDRGFRARVVDWVERHVAPFGITPSTFEVPTGNSWVTPASYHLELHAPSGLSVDSLSMAEFTAGLTNPSAGPVAHLVSRPKEAELPPSAVAELVHLPDGRLWQTAWSATYSLLFFLVCLVVPGVLDAFLEPANRSASSFLSSIPAIILALLARGQENPLVARLHAPLRYSSFLLAVCFLLTSFCVVAGATESMVEVVIGLAATYAGLLAILSWSGWAYCRRSKVRKR